MQTRLVIWDKISGEWKLDKMAALFSECSLEELDGKIDTILQGKVQGRVVVNLSL